MHLCPSADALTIDQKTDSASVAFWGFFFAFSLRSSYSKGSAVVHFLAIV